MSADCLQRMGIRYTPTDIQIDGVGNTIAMRGIGFVDLELCHRTQNGPSVLLRLVVVRRLTNRLPAKRISRAFTDVLPCDALADPYYFMPAKIDILIGAGSWSQMLTDGIKRQSSGDGELVAQNTLFGWVIFGTSAHPSGGVSTYHLSVPSSGRDEHRMTLDEVVRSFWEIETIPEARTRTQAEQQAEDNFMNTHTRDESGRYTVTIPMRANAPSLGASRDVALKRFLQLERKLKANPELYRACCEFMQDYIDSGHMVPAPPRPDDTALSYNIPYHAIHRKKFRVVFDASCASSNGVSFNDQQLPGGKLQPDICETFLRFRTRPFALTGDIVKMFRQVGVSPNQWNFQRIYWRPEPDGPIVEYCITVVVWGTTSATFNAVRALQQCAIDHQDEYPVAFSAAMRDFYVDDFLSGSDTKEGLAELHSQITTMLNRGGFELAKMATNDLELDAKINTNRTRDEVSLLHDTGILGMVWDRQEDSLRLKLQDQPAPMSGTPTKADIIGAISRVYDPSGLFAPTVMIGKLIMQDFWRHPDIGWKDPAPRDLVKRWRRFDDTIREISRCGFAVPRWVGTSTGDRQELHVFTDASKLGYGAVLYIRTVRSDGTCIARIFTSKSRVAPMKTQSIPRLELFGVLLGARLVRYVRKAISLEHLPVFGWTDSAIVLAWLKKEPSVLSSFIGTRTAEITDVTAADRWAHVKGTDNPADLLSRGQGGQALANDERWWNGPPWLSKPKAEWPNGNPPELSEDECLADVKESVKGYTAPVVLTAISGVSPSVDPLIDELTVRTADGHMASLASRRSTYNGILRVTAYAIRFCRALKARRSSLVKPPLNIGLSHSDLPPPTVEELDAALNVWLGIAQRTAFRKEIDAIDKSAEMPRQSRLKRLVPYVDTRSGLLRATGRLAHSDLHEDQKHPIIVPSEHTFAKRMIANSHLRTMHGGKQLTIAYLRQRYWFIGLSTAVKRHINKECLTCIRQRKTPMQQLMGQLPQSRSTTAMAFARTGVDFAGPFLIRKTEATAAALRRAVTNAPSTPTTIKYWVAVFVCLVTRAIHLDIVRGLTVEAFLDAFSRFTARRGLCTHMISDNGTTFVGSDNELQRVVDGWKDGIPHAQLAAMGTEWTFNPPGAPHTGGIYEAGVKSFKHHLRRVVGNRILTSDQFYTLLTQIEACLNARPLFPASDDPSDLTPITPAHLVIGRSTLQRPITEDVQDRPDNRLTLWGLQQKLQQQFWTQWKEQYLIELQQRNKWYNVRQNLKANDMVLIMNENTMPTAWPLGRVVEVSLGSDGLVRTARVMTATYKGKEVIKSTYERPIQKLCILVAENAATPTNSQDAHIPSDPVGSAGGSV